MSIPPEPPEPPAQPPDEATTRSKGERRTGAFAATGAVLLISVVALGSGMFFLSGPGAALICVVIGSVLTLFPSTRQFAVGFLIASAILILVTAGVCLALVAVVSSTLAGPG